MTDRVVFEAAKTVIEKLGTTVLPVKLDPFIEKATKYNEEGLEMYLISALGVTEGGALVPVTRMMISADEELCDLPADMNEEEYEEEEEEEESDEIGDPIIENPWWGPVAETVPVFDFAITETGGGSYLFIPGPWLNVLQDMYLEVEKPAG